MNWQRIKKLILVFVAAFVIIVITGVAVAEQDNDIQIFKMGTDVTVQEKQVMTDVIAVGGNVTIFDEGQVAIATGLWIGKKILTRREKLFIPFLVGMLILAAIGLIPLAGGLIILMLNLFGLGAVLLSRVGTLQPETIKNRFDQLEGSTQPSGG